VVIKYFAKQFVKKGDLQVKKVGLALVMFFFLQGCAYQLEYEVVKPIMLTLLLDSEKRGMFIEASDAAKSGMAYLDDGQFDSAAASFKKAMNLWEKFENKALAISMLSYLSRTYTRMGEHIKGLEYAERAYEKSSQTKTSSFLRNFLIAEAFDALGSAYLFLGDFNNAEYYYNESLNLIEKAQKKLKGRHIETYARSLNSLGIVYAHEKKYSNAIEYMTKSLTVAEKHNLRYEGAVALTGLADVHGLKGNFEEAIHHKKKAISTFETLDSDVRSAEAYLHMAHIYLNYHHPDFAYPYLEKHMLIVRKNEITNQIWVWELHRLLGKYYFQKHDFEEALAEYEKSIEAIESIRSTIGDSQFKTGYLTNKLEVYDEYIQLLTNLHRQYPEKGYDIKSFEIFERRQGRAFLEEIGKTGARQYAGLPDEVRRKERMLERQISLLSKQLFIQRSKGPKDRDLNAIQRIETELENAQTLLKQLEREIEKAYPDYYVIKYPNPIQIKDLQQKLLRPGEAMLLYHVVEDKTYIWSIAESHFSSATIDAGREALNQRINIFRKNILRFTPWKQRSEVVYPSERVTHKNPDLYDLLFTTDIKNLIAISNNLYIVPTGPLYLLPFEALKNKNGRYLIEDYAVSYLSSASLLGILRQSQARRNQSAPHPLLAFANPVYKDVKPTKQASLSNPMDRQEPRFGKVSEFLNKFLRSEMQGNFINLEETEEEAIKISDILNAPSSSNPLQLREKASRSNVLNFAADGRLDDYRYLVFACHGIIPESTTMVKQPALVLSQPDPVTNGCGFLTMSDVFGLKMNADLITLSACNTGRGESVPSEGVMGLTRAFMYAGTPSVTVTLWSVDSFAAKELNVGLFKHLKKGKSRMEALRRIKLAMINGEFEDDHGKKWQDPYYWAPVVMFGDGS
jgi:CHAT domain-containing protein